MAVHMPHKSLYISQPSSAKQQREIVKVLRILENVSHNDYFFVFLFRNDI